MTGEKAQGNVSRLVSPDERELRKRLEAYGQYPADDMSVQGMAELLDVLDTGDAHGTLGVSRDLRPSRPDDDSESTAE